MRSLSARLILVPTLILLAGLAATIAFTALGARSRVRQETESGLRLARILVEADLRLLAGARDPGATLARLEADLPTVRHVDLVVLPATDIALFGALPMVRADGPAAPSWLARLIAPPPAAEIFPLIADQQASGTILLIANPLDEIGEIWNELRYLALLLALLALAIVLLLVWTVRRALRPIALLTEGFDRLEHGRFEELPRPIDVAELRRMGEQFNSLARSLARVTDDNHTLIDRLISLQEAERKAIARELHDAFGASLFGIRAELACILRATRQASLDGSEIADRARSIGEVVDGIQRINARMLDRLRPKVLEEMGLAAALRELVDTWTRRCPGTAFSLAVPAAFDIAEPAALALYRVVQECLTNVVRHAGATCVEITLSRDASSGAIDVAVQDDGRGLPETPCLGLGILGMGERVRALGGRLEIGARATGGTIVRAILPAENVVRNELVAACASC